MLYESTREKKNVLGAMEAIKQGISPDGGLFVPQTIPAVLIKDLASLVRADYRERAKFILNLYLTDFKKEDINNSVQAAYNEKSFQSPDIAPLEPLADNLHTLELWHGPTAAFKDMALQLLPHLMTRAIINTNEDKEIVILTATSGDTGKAALEGFKDVEGTRIMVFYPAKGVSNMQRLQMITQEGENVKVMGVEGNFDDTQSGVKSIFASNINKQLEDKGFRLSSANSINWGRLVPQIVYYFSAWLDLLKTGAITESQSFNVVVPTGNFGNILAAYYAKAMGLPIGRLICASNDNSILTDFINTGVYDTNRRFYTTTSPSMDILISSNLERLLYELYDRDDKKVLSLMQELATTGKYSIDGEALKRLQALMYGGYANMDQAGLAIRETFREYDYLLDTHTAVGKSVYDEYRKETGDDLATILVSTASPYKFPAYVLDALEIRPDSEDELDHLEILKKVTGKAIPGPLKGLASKPIKHKGVCEIKDMEGQVLSFLEQGLGENE